MPNTVLQKKIARERRKKHIKKRVVGTRQRPRLVVFRSLNQIYAQLIDDLSGKTLVSASSNSQGISAEIAVAKTKTEKAKAVGKFLAESAKKKKISRVIFDRSGYLYHGRIKALAEGAREGGLEF